MNHPEDTEPTLTYSNTNHCVVETNHQFFAVGCIRVGLKPLFFDETKDRLVSVKNLTCSEGSIVLECVKIIVPKKPLTVLVLG